MLINAGGLDHRAINESIRRAAGPCSIDSCCGQRFIAAGMTDKNITIHGVPDSPLPDDAGIRFAIDLGNAKGTVVLLCVRAELHDVIRERVSEYGVFTLSKPLSRPVLSLALNWMASTRERLRKLEKKTLSVEEKMEEIRLVNRAKWLLISELKMDEPQAHHYIEKQAMDRCISKKEVAEEIIKTYK